MLVLIKKDDSTSVPREVADMAEAQALAAQGMPVFLQNEDGSTTPIEPLGEAETGATEAAPSTEAKKATPAKKAARKR